MSVKKKVEESQRYKYLPTGEVFVVVGLKHGTANDWNMRSETDPEQQCFETASELTTGRYQLLPARTR
jgi:hypothetical protein